MFIRFSNNFRWIYQSEKKLNGSLVDGLVNSYSGGGYVALLSSSRDETEAIIKDLKDNLWITRGTRAIFIDLTVYNANLNLFCQIR